MKRYGVIILALMSALGCAKKEAVVLEEPAVSMESLTAEATAPAAESKAAAAETMVQAPQVTNEAKLESLPPAGPYKPAAEQVQAALKNAGFYAGDIDGKVGPKTKRAIEEFQKANTLKADGKVGPKTWAALSAYLSAPSSQLASSHSQ